MPEPFNTEDGALISLEQLREDKGEETVPHTAMMLMHDEFSFEDCLYAFFHPHSKKTRRRVTVCAFAGIVNGDGDFWGRNVGHEFWGKFKVYCC